MCVCVCVCVCTLSQSLLTLEPLFSSSCLVDGCMSCMSMYAPAKMCSVYEWLYARVRAKQRWRTIIMKGGWTTAKRRRRRELGEG
ncbi:MAG: hypothetical protein BYD32DRAFT_415008 [Podila humilis]|nr:MAG: hypothetical protein BYD32DRAFT_415008 [Podila humilis]